MSTSDPSRLIVLGSGQVSFSKAFDLELAFLKIVDNDVQGDDTKLSVYLDCKCEFTTKEVRLEKEVSLRDDEKGYKCTFELSIIHTPRFDEKSLDNIYITKLKGSGKCNIGMTDLPGTKTHDFKTSIGFVFNSESALYRQLFKIKPNVISKPTVYTLKISCRDDSNGLEERFFQKITVTPYVESVSYKSVKLQVEYPLKVWENGGIRSLSIRKIRGLGACSIAVEDKNQLLLTGLTYYDYKDPGVDGNVFTILPVNDNKVVGDRRSKIYLQCKCGLTGKEFEIPLYLLIKEDDTKSANIVADPHFTQRVFDRNSYLEKSICYDVTGNPGDLINIAEHLDTKTVIYGELLDDYYIHVVKLLSKYGDVVATTKKIILADGSFLLWGSSKTNIHLDDKNFSYSLTRNRFSIKAKAIKEDIYFSIERAKHFGNSYYLNVNILGLESHYTKFDGLLGRVGNNIFEFYDSVQDTPDKRASIKINDKGFDCSIIERKDTTCWLVRTDNALYPYRSTDYIFPKNLLNNY